MNLNKKNKIIIISLFVFGLFLMFSPVLAVESDDNFADQPNVVLEVPFGSSGFVTGLADYIQIFYEFVIYIIAVAAVIMIMFGGFKWATAAGNSSMVASAKKTITNALIGLALALTSFLLLYTINPSLVLLNTFRVPSIEMREDVGGFCPDPAELAEDSEVKDSYGNVIDDPTAFGFMCTREYTIDGAPCFGNICPGSYYCLPSVGNVVKYECIPNVWDTLIGSCNNMTKSRLEQIKYWQADAAICNEFTRLLDQEVYLTGRCVWIPEATNAKCYWCSDVDLAEFTNDQQKGIERDQKRVADGKITQDQAYNKADACSVLNGQLDPIVTWCTKFIQGLLGDNKTYACYVRWCSE